MNYLQIFSHFQVIQKLLACTQQPRLRGRGVGPVIKNYLKHSNVWRKKIITAASANLARSPK